MHSCRVVFTPFHALQCSPSIHLIYRQLINYSEQAETANCYSWLTSRSEDFKPQSKQVAPFDWSDITELAKSKAAAWLSQPSDRVTSVYWQMGVTPSNVNNWVAIWFLYHKFRYRDGRNRSKDSKKGTKNPCKSGSGGKKPSTERSSSYRGSPNRSSPPARSLGMLLAAMPLLSDI